VQKKTDLTETQSKTGLASLNRASSKEATDFLAMLK
jgi:hypothetical protein